MLFGEGKIPPSDVDITFAIPSRDWMAGINRPTINFYLHSISENTVMRESDFLQERQSYQVTRRLRPRRIDLRYLITTHFKSQLAESSDEEWQILWRVLATLMKNSEWPDDILPQEIRELEVGVRSQVAQSEGAQRTSEIFTSLNVPPRAALHFMVTAPLDLNIEQRTNIAVGVDLAFRDSQGNTLLQVQRFAWRLLDEHGAPYPGVEVRLPDVPSYSVSGADGTFTTRLPHAEVKQLLIKYPDSEDWEVLKVKKGQVDLMLKR